MPGRPDTGIIHFPERALNDPDTNPYILFVPADYAAPASLTIDGINAA